MTHTDEFDLDLDVDIVVYGTGLCQSIVAAACARRGRATAHFDADVSYGANFGSLRASADVSRAFDAPEHSTHPVRVFGSGVDASTGCLTPSGREAMGSGGLSGDGSSCTRGYSIDINAPRVVLGADEFVECIVDSTAHKYMEFKAIEKTYVVRDGVAEPMASNRSDVFKDTTLSGAEKRALMRFLKLVHVEAMKDAAQRRRSGRNGEETNVAVGAPGSEWGLDGASSATRDAINESDGLNIDPDETMDTFLTRHGLSEKLRAGVTYALALQTRVDCDAASAIEDLKVYILSVAKYGPQTGACLIPVYGAADMPQAFCRVAAVEGATYVLRQALRNVNEHAEQATSVVSAGGQDIPAKFIFMPAPSRANGTISVHAVCVLDASMTPEFSQLLVVFPPGSVREDARVAVRALQIGAHTGCCPNGRFILYVSHVIDAGDDQSDPYRDVRAVLRALVRHSDNEDDDKDVPGAFGPDATKPTAIWGMMYTQPCGSMADVNALKAPGNVSYCVDYPDASATYRGAMRAAQEAYGKLFDDDMFPIDARGNDDHKDDDDDKDGATM